MLTSDDLTHFLLQGSTKCSDATVSFFSTNDQCSRAFEGIFSGNESAIVGLYYGDCPMWFLNFTTVCSDFNEVNNIIPYFYLETFHVCSNTIIISQL